jgi:CHAD domain-containing protein
MNKKWKIEKLRYSKKLKNIADLILEQRISTLINLIEKYLNDKNEENLHDVRIALRRVRYNLELFLVCYDESSFSKFYIKIEKLQNLSGQVRDIDVMLLNLKKIEERGVKIEKDLIDKILEERSNLENELIDQLNKFLKGKSLKQFLKEINYLEVI